MGIDKQPICSRMVINCFIFRDSNHGMDGMDDHGTYHGYT